LSVELLIEYVDMRIKDSLESLKHGCCKQEVVDELLLIRMVLSQEMIKEEDVEVASV